MRRSVGCRNVNNNNEQIKRTGIGKRHCPETQGFAGDGAVGMTRQAADVTNNPARVVSASGRNAERTASARCACYALLSELACSPHDIDPRAGLHDKIGAGAALEYASGLDALLHEFVALDLDTLKLEYSALFEVGSDGPPCPIREDLQTGQRAGTREDLVRFYSYFNYKLEEKFAWAPDHLSVELEFMHFLCYREATFGPDAASYQLAQVDFSQRHLVRWVPKFARSVAKVASDSVYCRIIDAIDQFLTADHAWQCGTIIIEGRDHGGRKQ